MQIYRLEQCFGCGNKIYNEVCLLGRKCPIDFVQGEFGLSNTDKKVYWNFYLPSKLFHIHISDKIAIIRNKKEDLICEVSIEEFDFDLNNLSELEDRCKLLSIYI